MAKAPPVPPANRSKAGTAGGQKQAAKNAAAKQLDKESPEKRGQAANTKINTTHQGLQQDR